jgi:hypothetical protein
VDGTGTAADVAGAAAQFGAVQGVVAAEVVNSRHPAVPAAAAVAAVAIAVGVLERPPGCLRTATPEIGCRKTPAMHSDRHNTSITITCAPGT